MFCTLASMGLFTMAQSAQVALLVASLVVMYFSGIHSKIWEWRTQGRSSQFRNWLRTMIKVTCVSPGFLGRWMGWMIHWSGWPKQLLCRLCGRTCFSMKVVCWMILLQTWSAEGCKKTKIYKKKPVPAGTCIDALEFILRNQNPGKILRCSYWHLQHVLETP